MTDNIVRTHKIRTDLPRAFPCKIEIDNNILMLNGDGTYEGDFEAFKEAATQMPEDIGYNTAIAWLIIRSIENSGD